MPRSSVARCRCWSSRCKNQLSAALTLQPFNESRGDSPIDRFIAEGGKGPCRISNEYAAVAGGADAGKFANDTGRGDLV